MTNLEMAMNRTEAIAALERLALDLEADLRAAQTRAAHITLSQRIADTRRIIADLTVDY